MCIRESQWAGLHLKRLFLRASCLVDVTCSATLRQLESICTIATISRSTLWRFATNCGGLRYFDTLVFRNTKKSYMGMCENKFIGIDVRQLITLYKLQVISRCSVPTRRPSMVGI